MHFQIHTFTFYVPYSLSNSHFHFIMSIFTFYYFTLRWTQVLRGLSNSIISGGGSFLDPDDRGALHPPPPLHHLHLLLPQKTMQPARRNGATSLNIILVLYILVLIINSISTISMIVKIRHRRSRRSLIVTPNQELPAFTVRPGLLYFFTFQQQSCQVLIFFTFQQQSCQVFYHNNKTVIWYVFCAKKRYIRVCFSGGRRSHWWGTDEASRDCPRMQDPITPTSPYWSDL